MRVTEPVLVMAFNRPDHLSRLLERLREVQPERLYVAIDGPRATKEGEPERVQACRDLVGTVDWPCEVHTLFQDHNLGCGQGVTTAISWFFDHEERGIILEDDIVPDPSFFPYCEELLERYQDDERVFAISGCNFVPSSVQTRPELPYRFMTVPHIWGWATWKDKWAIHNLDISDWRSRMPLSKLWEVSGHSVGGMVFWRTIFDLMATGKIDTWDMQLVFAGMEQDMYTATANTNLIDNIGFGDGATHTEAKPNYLRQSENIDLPTAIVSVQVDEKADAWSRKVVFGATTSGLVGQGLRYLKRKSPSS